MSIIIYSVYLIKIPLVYPKASQSLSLRQSTVPQPIQKQTATFILINNQRIDNLITLSTAQITNTYFLNFINTHIFF